MSFETRNPARPTEVVARYEATAIDDIPGILSVARAAQRAWAKVPMPERARVVGRVIDDIEAAKSEIAALVTAEQGKPLGEATGEVVKSAMEARSVLSRAYAPIGHQLAPAHPGMTAFSTRRPRGVVVGVCPWNFPVNTPLRKIIPALLYGNAIVLKPSEITPGAAMEMHRIASKHLPENLFRVVLGGPEFGAALTGAEGIDAISFTGSVATGKKIAAAAAMNLAEISLELGGKNPAIYHSTADEAAAASQIYRSAMVNAGQRCTAVSRVLVADAHHDGLVERLVGHARAERLGSGAADGTIMGPLVSAAQFDRVKGFVERAIGEGATVAAGGVPKPNDPGAGHFFPPTILTGVTRDMEIAREEVFGPVLTVTRFGSFDEAMEIANEVAYGLTSSLFSTDAGIVERFLAESESGMLHVNMGTFPDEHLPFVGVKASALGVGGSNGASLEQFFTSEHAVYLRGRTA